MPRARLRAIVVLLGAIAGVLPIGSAPASSHCVGDPPRQIEDPLGPPCVEWDGTDNGGATWRGVSGDAITVVLYNDFGIEGDMTAPYDPSQESGTPTAYYRDLVRTVKAHLRYFAERMETYGREVRVIAFASGGGLATRPQQRVGEIQIINSQYEPFAIVFLGGNGQQAFELAADLGILSFGMLSDVPRDIYLDGAPYIWSFLPDQETQAALSASFICGKLSGSPARFTDDPQLAGRPRTFALFYERMSQRGPQLEQLAALLEQEVDQRCGGFDMVRSFFGKQQLATAVQDAALDHITTLVCYCIPQESELDVPVAQAVASGLGYFPEWFWDPASGMDKVIWERRRGNPLQRGFGTTSYWRQPPMNEQYHYRAYQAMDPDGDPNLRFSFEIYHGFLSLFTAIQSAGPHIDPGSVLSGLKSWSARNAAVPWLPIGGHESSKDNLHAFIDSGMAWWWDPTGSEAGASSPLGCMRVSANGLRSMVDGWPSGDQDLFAPEDPCTGAPIDMVGP